MKRYLLACSTLLLFATPTTSQIPAEWKQVVDKIETLQANPLATDSKEQGAWIFGWLTTQKAVSITLCSTLTVPLTEKGDMIASRFTFHALLGAAKYALTVPQAQQSKINMYVASMNGALDAYQRMAAADQNNRRKTIEDVLKIREQGKLDEYVRKHSKECEQ